MLFYFCMRGCGCIARPVFPAPSGFRERKLIAKLGRIAPRECGLTFLNVIARSEATKQSSLLHFRKESWIASLALAIDVDRLFEN
jgi:hypothetical protein